MDQLPGCLLPVHGLTLTYFAKQGRPFIRRPFFGKFIPLLEAVDLRSAVLLEALGLPSIAQGFAE